jgi:hypothetical protein
MATPIRVTGAASRVGGIGRMGSPRCCCSRARRCAQWPRAEDRGAQELRTWVPRLKNAVTFTAPAAAAAEAGRL